MNTEIITVDEYHIDQQAVMLAGQVIKSGGLVAFPTETVYGLGGDAMNADSARKIYAAKGRPSDNPLIVHISRMNDLPHITEAVPEVMYRLADRFWPGPLTVVLKKAACVPMETTGGLTTVAVRMPANKTALAFIEAAGGYVAGPSANTSGRPSPTAAAHVKEDMQGRIDMIIDGGPAGLGIESTILDLTEAVPVILRPGAVTLEMLQEVLGEVKVDRALQETDRKEPPKAPGMKYKHYAPQGEMFIVEGSEAQVIEYINDIMKQKKKAGKKTGIIGTDMTQSCYRADSVKSLGKREDEYEIAGNLYRILREFDREGIEIIYAESFSGSDGMGQAVMNRLLKAAGYQVIRL